MKCPFCQADQFMTIGHEPITKHYSKTEQRGGGLYSTTVHRTWSITYYVVKYLCVNCGMVHERMDEQELTEMRRNQEHEKQ